MPPVGSRGRATAKTPETERLLGLGLLDVERKRKKIAELTISDKMYLLCLTALYLREKGGRMKTTGISPQKEDC